MRIDVSNLAPIEATALLTHHARSVDSRSTHPILDDRVRAFVAAYPNAVVVDLGGGLDCGAYRVDPPRSVDWYTVDLPAVVALRDDVLPPRPRTHSVGASLADRDWPDAIPPD